MKGIVVYQSKWGNCRQIAEAISRGLAEAGQDVDGDTGGIRRKP